MVNMKSCRRFAARSDLNLAAGGKNRHGPGRRSALTHFPHDRGVHFVFLLGHLPCFVPQQKGERGQVAFVSEDFVGDLTGSTPFRLCSR